VSSAAAPIVLAITGASGAAYGVAVLRALARAQRHVQLIVSDHGFRILRLETDIGDIAALRAAAGGREWDQYVEVFDSGDRGARPASGSNISAGMLICPCSMGTLSAVSVGASRSLVERAADVTLKERRRLVLVTRETPLSSIHLRNMLRLSLAGAVVLPASPGFYHRPASVQDLVHFIAARALDQFGVEHSLAQRWRGDDRASPSAPGGQH
jgi:4-hydroxy-3-polyprenylbenzoate decarboxylase